MASHRSQTYPQPVRRILEGVCVLLGVEFTPESVRVLLSSNDENFSRGDIEAKLVQYDAKIVYLLQHFDVHRRITAHRKAGGWWS
jgi:hypothetical protein